MYPLGCGMPDWYLTRPERELKEKREMIEKALEPCPICKGPVKLTVQLESAGMDGRYYDWDFECQKCGLTVRMAADNFYGRTYSTLEEAVAKWNGRSWFKEEG